LSFAASRGGTSRWQPQVVGNRVLTNAIICVGRVAWLAVERQAVVIALASPPESEVYSLQQLEENRLAVGETSSETCTSSVVNSTVGLA